MRSSQSMLLTFRAHQLLDGTLPFLVGAIGTIGLDALILLQGAWYRKRSAASPRPVRESWFRYGAMDDLP